MKALVSCTFLAALTLAASQPVSAQELDLSEEELSGLVLAAMPSVLQGIQARCRQVLDADAFMLARAEALDRRLTAAATAAWPSAVHSIARIAANGNPAMGEVLANMPPETLRPMLHEFVAGMINTRVRTDQCARIDQVLALLEPLPPANLARLLAIAIAASQNGSAS